MPRCAQGAFDYRQPQDVQHRQRRRLAHVGLQDAVRRLDPPQHLARQPHGPRAVSRWQVRLGQVGQHPALSQNRTQHRHRRRPRLHALCHRLPLAALRAYIIPRHQRNPPMSDDHKHLPPEARRALAEAEARRKSATAPDLPPELGGRKQGLEPVRYGDWEKKGIAVDF